jgi:UbiD family decarboxylase
MTTEPRDPRRLAYEPLTGADDTNGDGPNGVLDLREWFEELRAMGELTEVPGASTEYEIGAITDINAKHHGPALLFTDIPGYEGRGRVLSCSLSRAARLASALGFQEQLDAQGLVRALQGKPRTWRDNAPNFAPRVVAGGPVMEQILEGDDIDLTSYPAPLWHEGDGGRYIVTGGGVITRDPEDGWVNFGTYRVMVHGPNELGIFIEPIHHGAIQIQRWHERGEPCPVAVVVGHHPLLHLASAMPMPWGMSEFSYAGAMLGRPIDVIEGAVTGLPIPAAAELVIEGFIHPGEERDEGPFGEFTGYFAGGRHPRPLLRAERIYQRSDPVIYGSLPSKPPFDHSYWRATMESSLLLTDLEAAGIPEVKAVWKHEAGSASFFTAIAIKQRYAGHARQVGLAAATVSAGASMGRYIVVVDEDVNVMDLEEVIWVMSTRSDPVSSIQIVENLPSNPLDPMLHDLSKPWMSSRAIIDACRAYERREDYPAVVEVSPELAERMRAQWSDLLGWPR